MYSFLGGITEFCLGDPDSEKVKRQYGQTLDFPKMLAAKPGNKVGWRAFWSSVIIVSHRHALTLNRPLITTMHWLYKVFKLPQ